SASDPAGRFFYINNNGDQNTSAFTINPANGALTAVQGSPFNTGKYGDMAIDPSGRFLLGAGFLNKNLEAYAISSTGVLTFVNRVCFTSAGGGCAGVIGPNNMAIDPLGRFAFTGNGDGTVSAYTIDKASGTLALVSGSPFAATGATSRFSVAVDP